MSEVDVIVDRCGEQIAMAAETLGASITMARPRGRLSSDASGARIIRLFVRVDYGREVKDVTWSAWLCPTVRYKSCQWRANWCCPPSGNSQASRPFQTTLGNCHRLQRPRQQPVDPSPTSKRKRGPARSPA